MNLVSQVKQPKLKEMFLFRKSVKKVNKGDATGTSNVTTPPVAGLAYGHWKAAATTTTAAATTMKTTATKAATTTKCPQSES